VSSTTSETDVVMEHVRAAAEHGPRWDYGVFGGRLRSELQFPDLAPVSAAAADWTLRVSDAEVAPDETLALVGERQLGLETYRLFSGPQRIRLEYSHAGSFDISLDGTEITWYRRDDVILELVRSIVLGPALAIALELAGVFCLHGSAVSVSRQVHSGDGAHGRRCLPARR
jgi:hypothetical protein